MTKVAILVPAHDCSLSILESLIVQLSEQTYQSFRLYIAIETEGLPPSFFVDLEKLSRLKKLDVRQLKFSGKQGLGFALNKSLTLIEEDVVIRHDAGDKIFPNRVEKIVQAFQQNSSADLVYSNAIISRDGNFKLSNCPKHKITLALSFCLTSAIIHPTVAFKRKAVIRVGNYSKHLGFCEDLDLWLRMLKAGQNFHFIDAPLIQYCAPEKNRPREHWKKNLQVRMANLGSPFLIGSLIGIIAVSVYVMTPVWVSAQIYKLRR